uniref:Uncharacterized protein n=1 Tax=Glossina palpalis gambiensis TaxID=67801 RepID=A0A1B0BM20_9MUSC
MKLTICQFSKLFLLLTAFFYILDQCNVLPASAIVTIKAETVSIVYDKDDDKNNNNNKHNNNNNNTNNNNKNNKDIKKFVKVKELYSSEIFRNLENSLETTTTTTTRTTTATLIDKLEDTLTKNEVSLLMKILDNKQEQQEQQQEQQQQIEQVSTITTINERIAKDLNIGKSIEKLSKHNQSLYVRLKGSINKNENKNKNKNDNDNRNDSSNDYYNVDKNDDENNKNNNNNNDENENENVNAKDNKASDVHSMTAAAGIDLKILSAHKLTTLVRDVENQQHFMANKQKATTKTTIIPSSTIILSNDFIWQKSKKQQQEQPQYKLRSSPTLLPSPLPSPTPSPLLSSLASILMPANKITSTAGVVSVLVNGSNYRPSLSITYAPS